ncbi:TPA: hypothetical protein ACH3X1_006945 [Trebouxia sp. C0004]
MIRNCMALAAEHSSLGCCSLQVHILDPTLGPQMINNDIQNADGSPIRFADLDGTLLKFATEARPAKRAFAWYAEQAKRLAGQQQPSLLCLQLLGAQTLVCWYS